MPTEYVERFFRPGLGDKLELDFSDGFNCFGTLYSRVSPEGSPAIVIGSEISGAYDGMLMTVFTEYWKSQIFEYSDGQKFKYNYGLRKWSKINE